MAAPLNRPPFRFPYPMPTPKKRYHWIDFDTISPVPCPCGQARRAFADNSAFPGTLHRTHITTEAKLHYHQRLTETYYILECSPDAQIQLDDDRIPLKPGMAIVIPPGVRHRAIGEMTVLNVVLPEFDPADEFVVDGE